MAKRVMDMAEADRPREKLVRLGAAALRDVILKGAFTPEKAKEVFVVARQRKHKHKVANTPLR